MPTDSEQSPNWATRSSPTMLPEQLAREWPFTEGVPSRNRDGEFEIILRDGRRMLATVDLSTQYRAEGIQWRTREGTFPKQSVACWRTKSP